MSVFENGRGFIGLIKSRDVVAIEKKEHLFQVVLRISGIFIIVLLLLIFGSLLSGSFLSIKTFGFRFFTTTEWDPFMGNFGILPFLTGTLITSFMALFISLPFSLAISLFIGEYFKSGWLVSLLKSAIELLAGIPSVVYGFIGIVIVVPFIRNIELRLGVLPYGVGILAASVVLAVMIIPFSASISSEVIKLVPKDLKEAAYSLGATRYEVIRNIVFPYARSGIFAGFLLSLGRAIGETMAVTMVIGNSNYLPTSIFSPGNTMASIIANDFNEATDDLYLSSLLEIALVLLLVSVVVNVLGRYIIKKTAVVA